MEAGHLEEADEYKMEGGILEMKNSLLSPIYSRMKTIVRDLKRTEVSALYEEYQLTEQLLREKIVI